MQNVKRAFTWTRQTSLTALILAIFTMGSFLMETLSVDDLPVSERGNFQVRVSAISAAYDVNILTIDKLIHNVADTSCCLNNHVQNNDNRNNDFSYCYLVSNHHHWNNDDDGHGEEDDLDVWDDKDSTSDDREDTSNEQDVA
jgi:hypothetical protein